MLIPHCQHSTTDENLIIFRTWVYDTVTVCNHLKELLCICTEFWTFPLHQFYHDRFESILILPKIIYLFFCSSWFYYRTRFGFSVFVAMRNFLTIVRWPTLRAKTKKMCLFFFLWSSICLPLQVEIFLKCWFFVNEVVVHTIQVIALFSYF